MKTILLGLLIGVGFISCQREKNTEVYFREKPFNFLNLRHGYDTSNRWIRKPQHILMLHETFKKIGYQHLISQEELNNNPSLHIGYMNRSLREAIDSLVYSYTHRERASPYYREFWARREREENQQAVYKVLQEVKLLLTGQTHPVKVNEKIVNDTLYTLLSFEYPQRSITSQQAHKQLNYLTSIGLHQSAYNIRSGQAGQYSDIQWKESLEKAIGKLDTSATYQRTWFEDNTP